MDEYQENDRERQEARQVDQSEENPYFQEFSQPAYAAPVYPIKKKTNPVKIIVPIAAAAVVIAAAVILVLSLMGNGGYKKAESDYISALYSSASDSVGESKEAAPQSAKIDVSLSSDEVSEALGISDFSVYFDSAVNGDASSSVLSFGAGDMELSLKLWTDAAAGKFMMQLPEISSVYLTYSSEENEVNIDYDVIASELGNVLNQTLEVYFETVGDPESAKADVSFEGYEFTADKTEITLTEAQTARIVKAFIDGFKADEPLVAETLKIFGKETVEELFEELGIDEDEIAEAAAKTDSETVFKMNAYVNGGKIVGREMYFYDDGDIDNITIYSPVIAGRQICYVYYKEADTEYYGGQEMYLLIEDGAAGDIHDGSAKLYSADGEDITEINAVYTDLALTDELFQGSANISSGTNMVSVELSKDGDVKTTLVTAPNICTVLITVQPSVLAFEEMPKPEENRAWDLADEDSYESAGYTEFMNDLTDFIMGLMPDDEYDDDHDFDFDD